MQKDRFPYTYKDWKKVVDKLEEEVKNANAAEIDIGIAKECQQKLLDYVRMRLGDYPEPVIMPEEEEKTEEKPEEAPAAEEKPSEEAAE